MIPHALYDQLKRVFSTYHWQDKKIIATVSGGADSMALCYVLKHLDVQFVIAHCNFGLRGDESNADEQFVATWATAQQIPFYVQRFDTRNILANQGGNLQDICRQLRYEWFETLRAQLGYQYIATAHHKDDVAETVLMNLMRGTGIAGMHGILPVQQQIIRPLLSVEKSALEDILHANDCTWREDSSNKKDDYLRNRIRHHLIPLMNTILSQSVDGIYKTSQRLHDIENIAQQELSKTLSKLVEPRGNDRYISINKLYKQPGFATLLYEIISTFGFSSAQMPDILSLLDAQTGKMVMNDRYRIIKNRDFLIITDIMTVNSDCIVLDNVAGTDHSYANGTFRIAETDNDMAVTAQNAQQICTDAALLEWPLILRPYRTGDYFYPIGMGMKKKKVSKLLKDCKIPQHDKEKVWVLESNKKIVWVVGIRMDERFKVTATTRNIAVFRIF